MKRYIKTYLVLLRLNAFSLLAYRVNFISTLFVSVGWGILSIISIYILTFRVSTIYGWNKQELLLFTGFYGVLIGLFHMFFSRNFERFSRMVHRGELDAILTKPMDSQFLLSFWLFSFVTISRIIISFVFSMYLLTHMQISISLGVIALFFFFSMISLILLYSIWFIVLTMVIWFTNLSNLSAFLYLFNNLARYPEDIILGTKNIILFILLPITFVSTVPVKVLLAKATLFDYSSLLVCSFGLFYLSRKFWKFALRFYTSAGG